MADANIGGAKTVPPNGRALIMFSKFRHTVSDQYLILVSVHPYILALGCKRLRF